MRDRIKRDPFTASLRESIRNRPRGSQAAAARLIDMPYDAWRSAVYKGHITPLMIAALNRASGQPIALENLPFMNES